MQRKLTPLAALLAALTITATASALDQEVIERPVNEKQGELESCYEAAKAKNPKLRKGKIVTRYLIDTDGKVPEAKTIRNELADKELGECVRKVFLSLEYGEQEEKTRVTFPLTFE
jgi:hypothetical protein